MTKANWRDLAGRLEAALHPTAPPIAITFSSAPPAEVPAFDEPMVAPSEDGRSGRVPAGCVFWVKAIDRTFSTVGEDHGNCSVGSLTHGFKSLAEAATGADVAALVESGWVGEAIFPEIPVVSEKPGAISYGPLSDTPLDPDVILLRIHAQSAMVLSDALPDLRIEGKPQCHIVALATQDQVAVSVGCALSRARTGIKAAEMTCAIPAARLEEIVERIETTARIDSVVAQYAGHDAQRFR